MRRGLGWGSFIVAVLSLEPVDAQTIRDGRLIITVADQTRAVIPGATVTITPQEGPNRTALPPQTTTAEGVVTFQGLTPGRFTVLATFDGFEPGVIRDVRVRAGDNRQDVALDIQKLEDTVTVSQDPSTASSDRRGVSFGTVMTREQIDALSEDPEEMRRQLADMVGPGAVIKVDSFEGAQLPPKSQIRMIRISRDQFAAEHHAAGGLQIDIVTQPGLGPLRGGINTRIQDGSMTGRSPFVEEKGPERSQNYSFNLSGTIVPGRTSFSMNANGLMAFDTPNINVSLPSGMRSEALALRRPRDNAFFSVSVDHALTKDQTLRFNFYRNGAEQDNLGVGDYNLPERAYLTESGGHSIRAQHVGPLGRRWFINTRLQVTRNTSETRSELEAITIRVLDAFTSGGQQLAGGSRIWTTNFASDLDYVRGRHSIRTGIVLDGVSHRSDSASNYLGTYTFESLEAFEQGTPRSYTRRIGDPNISYLNMQGGLYIQDDIRLRPNLTLSPGLRYELQTHVADFNNLAPRVGLTWSPGTGGRTSIRASAGLFYDWLAANTYEQTLRVDGVRQRELNIAEPSYPDPGRVGLVPPVNRYLLGDGVRMPRLLRFSSGVDRGLTRQSRLGFLYTQMRGTSLQRGRNLNAPVDGVRPDPEFVNVVEVVSDAATKSDTLTVFFNASFNRPNPAPGPTAAPPGGLAVVNLGGPRGQPLFDWRRMSVNAQYTAGWNRNNTDGDFSVAPTGDLDREWGATSGDVRHRLTASINSTLLRNLSVSVGASVATGTPYTLLTGYDDNSDLIFNDRPGGIGRNTVRAAGQFNVSGSVNYSFTFGKPVALGPGQGPIAISIGPGGAASVVQIAQPGRYRVNFFVQGQNLTNYANYIGYSGVMTSSFFGQPTSVLSPRRIDIGVTFGF